MGLDETILALRLSALQWRTPPLRTLYGDVAAMVAFGSLE